MTARTILTFGAVLAGTGVALGAFGAHGLEKQLQSMGRDANLAERSAWFDAGVRYQLYHGLALVAVAALALARPDVRFTAVCLAFVVGIALFCGSLYVMTFAGDAARKLGAVTPLGGLALLVGWAMLAVLARRLANPG
jgi:uncharacterized membrane protein YgdD (TMEM256/DUF423 family)